MNLHALAFWSLSATEMLQQLHATPEGLTGAEARQRLTRYGANLLKPQQRSVALTLLLAQFKSPLVLILLSATGLSFFLHAPVDALILLTIVLVSGLLGFWQERSATNAVEKLLAIVQITAAVRRDGAPKDVPIEEIVPGDIVILNAGDVVPGDCLVQKSEEALPGVSRVALLWDATLGPPLGVLARAAARGHGVQLQPLLGGSPAPRSPRSRSSTACRGSRYCAILRRWAA